jgi:hypothetical protein
MSVVAPITIAWQGVVDSAKGDTKEIETFKDLDEAVFRAREVNQAAKSLQNSNYAGSNPKAHITIHPGAYQYGDSVDQNTDLEDIFITILPGATVTDSEETFSPDTTENVADLNSFAETAFFSEKEDTFVFDSPVRFKDEVVFQENTFPVKSIEGGEGISVSSSFGDVTITHSEETGGASENSAEDTFLNKIQFDKFGHVTETGFGTVTRGVGVEDDGSQILGLANDINFASNLSVIDDQDGTATVKIPGTDSFKISALENLFPIGEKLSKLSGTQGKEAKLGTSPSGRSRNDVFQNDTETEKGVIVSGVSGELNPQVEATDLHDSKIFAKASSGTLKLLLNGSNLVTVNLSSTESAILQQSASGASSLSVSSSNSLFFPNDKPFDRFTQRTGNWEVGRQDLSLGVNTIQVVHEIGGEVYGQTQTLQYFVEDTQFQVNVGDPSFSLASSSGGIKTLSGVNYHTNVTVDLSIDIDNVYRNVYSTGEAITFPVAEDVEFLPQEVPELESGKTEDAQVNLSKQSEVLADRLVLDSPTAQFEIEDPIEGKISSSTASNLQLLYDGKQDISTDTTHVFETERYRISPNKSFDTVIGTGEYDSTKLVTDGTDYENQLQVTGGKIVYPYFDYSQLEEAPPENPDYSQNITGQREYYGLFKNQNSVSNFVLKIKGTGEIVSPESLSAGTQVASVEIKAPTQTGWLDVNNYFTVGNLEDGDGAYQPTNAENPNKTIGPDSEIGITIGRKDTVDSFNRIYYRITAPENWTGEITEMNISWGVS